MPQTPNHGYNVPSKGNSNWHQPLNDNFRQYDTDIEVRDVAANRSNYQPLQGAKFFATDTGAIYLGDGSSWTQLLPSGEDATFANPEVTGQLEAHQVLVDDVLTSTGPIHLIEPADSENEFRFITDDNGTDVTRVVHRYLDQFDSYEIELLEGTGDEVVSYSAFTASRDGNRRVTLGDDDRLVLEGGTATVDGDQEVTGQLRVEDVLTSDGPIHISEPVDSENEFRFITDDNGTGITRVVHRYLDLFDRYEIELLEETGSEVVSYTPFTASRDGSRRVAIGESDRLVVQGGTVTVDGDLDVTGNKNFTQTVETDDEEKEVVYTATEAGTPRTEASGVAELTDGRAEIDLPDHFGWVTSDDHPLVVQTTPYGGSAGLKVVERSTHRLVVEDLDGEGDYEFAYTVKGAREGHADAETVRDPGETAD